MTELLATGELLLGFGSKCIDFILAEPVLTIGIVGGLISLGFGIFRKARK